MIARFLGIAVRVGAALGVTPDVKREGEGAVSHRIPSTAANCWRTDLGKVWSPYSFEESDPEYSALWYTRELAMEIRRL
jgi:hypothetical protein